MVLRLRRLDFRYQKTKQRRKSGCARFCSQAPGNIAESKLLFNESRKILGRAAQQSSDLLGVVNFPNSVPPFGNCDAAANLRKRLQAVIVQQPCKHNRCLDHSAPSRGVLGIAVYPVWEREAEMQADIAVNSETGPRSRLLRRAAEPILA